MKNAATSNRAKYKLKAGAGSALALLALLMLLLILVPMAGEHVRSRPNQGRIENEVIVTPEGEEVDVIDWDFWKSVNPDVVGWITIPSTSVDYPIVQASKDNPKHYLSHDVYNKKSKYGCIYVDATSSMEDQNTILFGHNMQGTSSAMFGPLNDYLKCGSLDVVCEVIIQTPESIFVMQVRAADSVAPSGFVKQTSFETSEDLQNYYLDMWATSVSKTYSPRSSEVDKLFTLITCSKSGKMRTVVYVG